MSAVGQIAKVLGEHFESRWSPEREMWLCDCDHPLGEGVWPRDLEFRHQAHQATVLTQVVAPAPGFDAAREAALRAMEAVEVALSKFDGTSESAHTLVCDIARIRGAYSVERIG